MIERAIDAIVAGLGHPASVPIALLLTALGLYVAGVDETNIAISIVSIVLLLVLQHSQNRDSAAIQAKLDALISGVPGAPNHFIGLDRKPEAEIKAARDV